MAPRSFFVALGNQRLAIGLVLVDRTFLLVPVLLERLEAVLLDTFVGKVCGRPGQSLLLAFTLLARSFQPKVQQLLERVGALTFVERVSIEEQIVRAS